MTDLLIITCSKAKNNLQNAPAIEVYNGNKYRILRKRQPKDLKILIISAKYGLITPETRISWYDQLMTEARALELSGNITRGILKILKEGNFKRVFVDLPYPYGLTLEDYLGLDLEYDFTLAEGPRGPRLHQFSEWLKSREAVS